MCPVHLGGKGAQPGRGDIAGTDARAHGRVSMAAKEQGHRKRENRTRDHAVADV